MIKKKNSNNKGKAWEQRKLRSNIHKSAFTDSPSNLVEDDNHSKWSNPTIHNQLKTLSAHNLLEFESSMKRKILKVNDFNDELLIFIFSFLVGEDPFHDNVMLDLLQP